MPKFAVLAHEGFEDISSLEITELCKAKTTASKSVVEFTAELEDGCKIAYRSQSIKKILAVIKSFTFTGIDDIEKNCVTLKFDGWIDKASSFAVRCIREGTHGFSGKDIEALVGESIVKRIKAPVDLEHPLIPVCVFIKDNSCIIGIDLVGFDLSKRSYHLFTVPTALKGTVAYCALRHSGYKGKGLLLDPFAKNGTIPIEAALFAYGLSPNYFNKDTFAFRNFPVLKKTDFDALFTSWDRRSSPKTEIIGYDPFLRNVKASQKNAKIADINKEIQFSRADIEWLDTKKQENEIDFVVSYPPQPSKNKPVSDAKKMFKELFYQLEFIMKKKGVCVFICTHPELMIDEAAKYSFKNITQQPIYQGQECLTILSMQKA